MKNKILGNISEQSHSEILIIKATERLKTIEDTIRYLIDIYHRFKEKKE